jgi:hypothetical protein
MADRTRVGLTLDDRQRANLDSIRPLRCLPRLRDGGAFPAYATSNLSGQISKARERLAALTR